MARVGSSCGSRVAGGFRGSIAEMCSAHSTRMNRIMRMERRFIAVSESKSRGFAAYSNKNVETSMLTTCITPNSSPAATAFGRSEAHEPRRGQVAAALHAPGFQRQAGAERNDCRARGSIEDCDRRGSP